MTSFHVSVLKYFIERFFVLKSDQTKDYFLWGKVFEYVPEPAVIEKKIPCAVIKHTPGQSFSEELTTPSSGSEISLASGVKIAFTDDASKKEESFAAGDKYTFSSVAPTASTASILKALNAARQRHEAKFVHIIGETEKAFWTSVSQIADEWESKYHDHKIFILEATARDSETVKVWAQARIAETIGFYHKRIIVCAITVESTLLKREINSAWILSAKMAASRVHESPGYVDKHAFLTVSKIKDHSELSEKDENGSSYLDKLDNARLTVATSYENYPGMYFSKVNLMSNHTQSDFKRVQDIRPADKVRRIVRQAILKFLESPAHQDAGSGGIDSLKVTIDNEIAIKMEVQGDIEIAGHETVIDPDQDVVSTGKVEGKITIQKVGTMETIELDVSYEQ